MTRKSSPSWASKSKMVATPGWERRESTSASRRNRSRVVASSSAPRRSILMATTRSRLASCAFHTSPIPPSPMRSTSRYRPRTVPGPTAVLSLADPRPVTGAGGNGNGRAACLGPRQSYRPRERRRKRVPATAPEADSLCHYRREAAAGEDCHRRHLAGRTETLRGIRPSDPGTGASSPTAQTTRKDQIMGIRFLSPAAMTCLLLNTMVSLTPAAAQTAAQTAAQHTALASDSNFIELAMSLGLLQVKLGKFAQDKGSNDGVRDFGKRMVADYSKVKRPAGGRRRAAAYPHPVLLRQHQQIFDRFNTMSRSSPSTRATWPRWSAGTTRQRDCSRMRPKAGKGPVAQATGREPAAGRSAAPVPGDAGGGWVGADVTATTSQARKES